MQAKHLFRRRLLLIFIFISARLLLTVPDVRAENKKVLILHSYHQGLSWTDNIMDGMNSVFRSSGRRLEIHVEYMDSKRHPPDTSFSYIEDMLRAKYRQFKFDVILVSDNSALNFILPRRDELFPNTPVVFCGINNYNPALLENFNAVTGVTEEVDFKGTIDLALRLMPEIKQFLVINDRTPTGIGMRKKIETTVSAMPPSLSFDVCDSLSAADLKKRLAGLPPDSAVLVLTFFRDGDGRWLSIPEYLSLIRQNSRAPIFSLWEHYMGQGVRGGVMVSGEKQGACCAEYALRILSGESAESLPVVLNSPNVPMLDDRLIRKFGISQDKIPENAVILFRPESIFRKYQGIIIVSGLSFAALLVLIIILSINILIRRKMESTLKERETRLEHLKRVLEAVRIIHRLITHEKDRSRLLRRSCRSMVETRGFLNAWIVLTENGRPLEPFFHNGFNDNFYLMNEFLREGKVPHCGRLVLEKGGVQTIYDRNEQCGSCPLAAVSDDLNRTGLMVRLEYSGHIYGWMSVAVPRIFAMDEEEHQLLAETADDIALALWTLDTETRQQSMEKKYADVLRITSDAVVSCALDGRITLFNPGAEQLFRCPSDKAIETSISRFCPEDRLSELKEVLSRVKMNGSVKNIQTECLTADGQRISVEMTINLNTDAKGMHEGYSAILRDITERKKLEARLQQAQKMEAVGTLTGGIAHDFNNILFPMMGFAEMIEEDLDKNSPMHSHIHEILRASFRARDLVRQLLSFSRQSELHREPIMLQPIAKEALKLLRASIPATIEIRHDISPDCGLVMADPTQIHQIIMNLATNAYHAMETAGGKLAISVKQVPMEPHPSQLPSLSPGQYARLIVSDTGPGIPKTVIEKIFDPYFTTKQNGKGTGLGLSIVQGIVKSCDGDIRIYSETGKGTEVHVYLPVMEKKSDDMRQPGSSQVLKGRSEHILLADDEKAILDMEQQMLQRLGYRVTQCTGSIKALDRFKADPDAFDLIMTDMTMPKMTGIQLIREIRRIRPGIPAVICTGFSEQLDEETIQTLNIQGFILKPIISREMAEILHKALNNKGRDDASK